MIRSYQFALLLSLSNLVWGAGPAQALAEGAAMGAAKAVTKAVMDPPDSKKPAKRQDPNKAPIRPVRMPNDPSLVVFPYDQNYTYPIRCRPRMNTHIQLADGERVLGFYLSDTLQWVPWVTPTKQDLFLKPVRENLVTVGTLITTKRRYQLQFITVDDDDPDGWYQRVTWVADAAYIEDAGAGMDGRAGRGTAVIPTKITNPGNDDDLDVGDRPVIEKRAHGAGPASIQVEKLNFSYSIEGDASFRPLQVFDDGRFTWVKFPKQLADLPALFVIGSNGAAEVEDFLPPKPGTDYYVVPRLLPHGALLKLDSVEVRIKNKQDKCGGFFQRACQPVINVIDGR